MSGRDDESAAIARLEEEARERAGPQLARDLRIVLAALKRETERADRARVALTPFSILPNPNNSDDCFCAAYSFRAGDYRRARAVLAEIGKPE